MPAKLPEAISVSQMTLYLACSLKYRFQYVDRLPRLTESSGLAFGSSMHAALQWLHKERRRGRQVPLDELLRVFEADWYVQCRSEKIAFEDAEEADTLRLKGRELLGLYYQQAPKEIRESELRFTVPLINPATGEILDVPLNGVIDLVQADGTVDEFKNATKRFPLDSLPDNLQLTAYSYAFEALYGKPPKDLRLVTLVRTKKPDIDVQVTGRDKTDYERLFNVGREVLKGARAGVFIPNRGCWMCATCEYDEDCRAWTGNEEAS